MKSKLFVLLIFFILLNLYPFYASSYIALAWCQKIVFSIVLKFHRRQLYLPKKKLSFALAHHFLYSLSSEWCNHDHHGSAPHNNCILLSPPMDNNSLGLSQRYENTLWVVMHPYAWDPQFSIYMALIYLLFTLLAQVCKRNKLHKNKIVTVVEKSFIPKSSKSAAKQSMSL